MFETCFLFCVSDRKKYYVLAYCCLGLGALVKIKRPEIVYRFLLFNMGCSLSQASQFVTLVLSLLTELV